MFWYIQCVCAGRIVWCVQRSGRVCGRLGCLTAIRKNEKGKKWPNFKMTVFVNYSPKV